MKFRVSTISGTQPPCEGAYLETIQVPVRGLTLDGEHTEELQDRDQWFVDVEWSDMEQFIIDHEGIWITYLRDGVFDLYIIDADFS